MRRAEIVRFSVALGRISAVTTLLCCGVGQAQNLCPEVMQKPLSLTEGADGRIYSQDLLETRFTARPWATDLREINQAFRQLGVPIVVVPVPWSPIVNGGVDRYDVETARRNYNDVVSTFRQEGFMTVNLLNRFRAAQREIFFKTDHHWNAYGAELAAREIQRSIPKSVIDSLHGLKGIQPQMQGEFEFTGGFAYSVEKLCKRALPKERIFKEISVPLPEEGLLDENVPPVVLFGSSYSRSRTVNEGSVAGYGFGEWLSALLGVSLQNESASNGSQYSILHFLQKPENLEGRKLFIWELPIFVFAPNHSEQNTAFFSQIRAVLTQLSKPDLIPLVTQEGAGEGNRTIFKLDKIPLSTYIKLSIPTPTPYAPIVTFHGEKESRSFDLKREVNQYTEEKDFLLMAPTDIGNLKEVEVTWAGKGNEKVVAPKSHSLVMRIYQYR